VSRVRVFRSSRRTLSVSKGRRRANRPPDTCPLAAAATAGLRYVRDDQPGIERRRRGDGFVYAGADGKIIRNSTTLDRIRALAVPPAWTSVWICPDPRGHIQATGRDAKGRKQYRYHAAWRAHRDETKFDRLQAFAEVLPLIRRRANADLQQPGLPRNKVLATIAQLLEKSLIRIGNEEYARQNQSFGLTTLRARHVRVNGGTLRFQFRGKSGVRHSVSVNDRRLARVVKQCRDLPGQELFQYLDEAGAAQVVDSGDINDYLKEITGQDFTAKDFRTWSGTVLAATALREVAPPGTKRETERNVNVAIEAVAGLLGNTPTVCRKSYVHPGVVDAYRDGIMASVSSRKPRASARVAGLRSDEIALLTLLKYLQSRDASRKAA
jgi:DNA topoisomerase-1